MKRFTRSLAVLSLDEIHESSGIAAALLEQGVDGQDMRIRYQWKRIQEAVAMLNTAAMVHNTAPIGDKEEGLRKI